ncbi:MAG: S24 family peptidase [Desulfobacterales bacterium]|nr:S24 family peptidase [Desulfobacterales bacterium]
MKNPLLLSDSNLLKLSGDLLGKSRTIRFRAKGFSMRPFIQDGDLITVSPLRNSPVKVGDVVLYKTVDDQAIVHRVIRKTIKNNGTVFFIKGDAAFGQSEEVDTKSILGRVTAVERNGRERNLDTKLYRIIGLFFAGLSPFSRWIYPVGSRLKHKKRKHLGGCPRIGFYVISTKGRNLKLKYFQSNKISRSARNDKFGAFSYRTLGVILEKLQSLKLYGFLAKKLMKENIHYQIAVPDDASSLSLLYRYNQQTELENPTNALYEQLKNPEQSGYWLVAKRKDKVIGCVTLSEFQESDYPYAGWWLFGMKVNWRYRRMGIGEKLTKMMNS